MRGQLKLVKLNALVDSLQTMIGQKSALDVMQHARHALILIEPSVLPVRTTVNIFIQTPENVCLSVKLDISKVQGFNAHHADLHAKNA